MLVIPCAYQTDRRCDLPGVAGKFGGTLLCSCGLICIELLEQKFLSRCRFVGSGVLERESGTRSRTYHSMVAFSIRGATSFLDTSIY